MYILTLKAQRYSMYVVLVFKFQSVLLLGNVFELQTILRLVHRTNPVPHICVTTVPESQISVRLALWPAILELQAFWHKYTEWPQNDLENYRVKGTPYGLLVSPSRKFPSVWELLAISETDVPNDPQMTFNTTRSNVHVPYICITNVTESQASPHFPTMNLLGDTAMTAA